ncbi:MAG: LuxR C-terminal-related transcriptional regulator [Bacteroidales bacterium]
MKTDLLSSTEKIDSIIIEGNEFLRRGVEAVLDNLDFVHIQRAFTCIEEFELTRSGEGYRYFPDLFILGVPSSIESIECFVRKIKNEFKGTKILIISGVVDEGLFDRIIRLGVDGMIINTISSDDFARSVRLVYEGKTFFSEEYLPFFTQRFTQESTKEDSLQFSKRELEVLQWVVEGLSSQEIGAKLNISAKTVNNHRASLNSKAGVKNTAGLISFALKNGMIDFG